MAALALLAGACSLPRASDPNLLRSPAYAVQDPAAAGPLSDGSLWQDYSWTADLRARRVNDLLTIRITEKTTAVVKGDAATSRAGANTLKATGLANKLIPGVADGEAVTSTTAMNFKGSGNTGRSAAVTTTITARVVKVLANGNLVFEGYRDIQLNNETQRLYVAGLVNPVFLDAGNSIASGQVAELRLGYGGKGVVDETTKPGYVSRMLNYVWPY
jgi:flagellar L-ring protein precursor FlgH